MILGGSTNAVLHLIAIAHSVGLKLTIDDVQSVSDRIPFLADLKPSGKYVMEDVHKIGGIPCTSICFALFIIGMLINPRLALTAVLKYLHENKLIDGSIMTVTGKTLAENLEHAKDLPHGQDVIRPLSKPIKATGHLR
jgi:dihydroxy-acid dehydratase